MTAADKLALFKAETGRTWKNIAEILGVSRQMIDFVRAGRRNFGAEAEARLDKELSRINTGKDTTTNTTGKADMNERERKVGAALLDANERLRKENERLKADCEEKDREIAWCRKMLEMVVERFPGEASKSAPCHGEKAAGSAPCHEEKAECTCWDDINALLAPKGLRLSERDVYVRIVDGVEETRHSHPTEPIDPDSGAVQCCILMTHCPFCGKPYAEKSAPCHEEKAGEPFAWDDASLNMGVVVPWPRREAAGSGQCHEEKAAGSGQCHEAAESAPRHEKAAMSAPRHEEAAGSGQCHGDAEGRDELPW
ncbi:MAG: hypothetical protein ACOX9C_04345 [Kiritimatiellia bacterium]|jgi:predicted transcriptional regulator